MGSVKVVRMVEDEKNESVECSFGCHRDVIVGGEVEDLVIRHSP